jgi:hypothetical protein
MLVAADEIGGKVKTIFHFGGIFAKNCKNHDKICDVIFGKS